MRMHEDPSYMSVALFARYFLSELLAKDSKSLSWPLRPDLDLLALALNVLQISAAITSQARRCKSLGTNKALLGDLGTEWAL